MTSGGVWVCTRDPVLDTLSLPLHPCVILLLIFAASSFDVRGRHVEAALARAMWRSLLVTELSLCVFFLLAAGLVRDLFGTNPTTILRAVPYAWSIVGCAVVWLVWRRSRKAAPQDGVRKSPFVQARWAVLALAVAIAARPLISNSSIFLSAPYRIVEFLRDEVTGAMASDECLASRVIEYDHDNFLAPGHIAYNELEFRGASAVPGMAASLSDSLDLDAVRNDYFRRHEGLYNWAVVTETRENAEFGIAHLLREVGRLGGAHPVLHAWKTRGPDEHLRATAAYVLTCIRMGRQQAIPRGSGPNCALPGEIRENDKCYKVFGEPCVGGGECVSSTCEGGRCCQPFGEKCTGTECCGRATCQAGRCATPDTKPLSAVTPHGPAQ